MSNDLAFSKEAALAEISGLLWGDMLYRSPHDDGYFLDIPAYDGGVSYAAANLETLKGLYGGLLSFTSGGVMLLDATIEALVDYEDVFKLADTLRKGKGYPVLDETLASRIESENRQEAIEDYLWDSFADVVEKLAKPYDNDLFWEWIGEQMGGEPVEIIGKLLCIEELDGGAFHIYDHTDALETVLEIITDYKESNPDPLDWEFLE